MSSAVELPPAPGADAPACVVRQESGGGTYQNHIFNSNTLMLTGTIVFQTEGNNIQAFNRQTREFIRHYNGHTLPVTCLRWFDLALYSGAEVRGGGAARARFATWPLAPGSA